MNKLKTFLNNMFSKLVLLILLITKKRQTSQAKKLFNQRLLKMGIIPIDFWFEDHNVEETRQNIITSMLEYGHKKIYLVIDSGGGNTNSAFKLYDFLTGLSSVEIIGIVNGKCMSAAILILAACSKRFSFKHSTFLLHGITLKNTAINALAENLESVFTKVMEDFKTTYSNYENIVLDKFPIQKEKYRELSEDGKNFDRRFLAAQAKELGIIDEIIEKFPF
jgi:ATP-dependent protease ClpP protease subunit